MHKTHLYTTLILFILLAYTSVSSAHATPRLTVVVVVDGMNQENLRLLRPYWSKGGMRTLSEEAFQANVTFPHLVYGGNETTATLLTGTAPAEHGYAMEQYFSRQDRTLHLLLEDMQTAGIGTMLQRSPRNLLSPTIADYLRLQQGEQAKIYAVGIQPETTILLAGHAANACCWIDPDTQRWVSTSFYPEGLPTAADEQNMNGRFAELASRPWTPRMDIAMYMRPTEQEQKKSFHYLSSDHLTQCPAANTLVVELALGIQQSEKLGTDNIPDMLLLQLTTRTPVATSDHIQSAEQEDIYLCLNQDLGFFMEQLDKRIGHDNYEILLVGRPLLGTNAATLEKARLSINQFNVDRAAALTSTYLMALYGHERWVDGGCGQNIYLNRTLIEQKRLSLETLQRQAANFLMDFEGVQLAFPQSEALLHPLYSSSLNKRVVGDVFFTLQPGWKLMTDDETVTDYIIDSQPTAPILFWSPTPRPMPQGTLKATEIRTLLQL